MYPGHFAAALAMRHANPSVPFWGLLVGVGLLDLVYGVLCIAGLESGDARGYVYPWSHSAAMALIWALLYGACFIRRGWRVSAWMALAVLSHWVLDVLVHEAMPLWPYAATHWGLQPYTGGLAGWLEAGVTLAGGAFYALQAHRSRIPAPRTWLSGALLAALYALEFGAAHHAH